MKMIFTWVFVFTILSGSAQNFSQSFDSVSTLASYINFSLTTNRLFNGIGPAASTSGGAGASIISSAGSNKLLFNRNGTNNYFTRKYLGYNYPQLPIYGALLAKLNNANVAKPKLARSLGIVHLREGLTLTLPGSYSEPMYDSGFKVQLNVNYAPSDTGSVEFPDSTVFRNTLINALNTTGIKPVILMIENEEPNKNYHKGSALQYVNELIAGVNVAHSYGFKASNGGITAEVLRYLTYHDYVDRGKSDSALAFYNRTAAQYGFDTHYNAMFLQASGRFCDTLLNAYVNVPMDYINFHWYGGDEGGSESDILHQCINFLERKTGKKAITNEIGQYDTTAAVVNDLLNETIEHQLPMVYWYDGDGTQAIALNNTAGVLRPNGVAFRDYLASHQVNYVIPNFISVSFKVLGSNNTTQNTLGNYITIGNGFSAGNSAESDDSVHSRINIAFSNNTPGNQRFKIGDGNGNLYPSGTGYNNEKLVTWIINNSGAVQTYIAPDGTTQSVADDAWDLWVGTALAYDEHASFKTGPQLNDIKFLFSQGDGDIQFDDISIQRPTSSLVILPVQYASFQGRYIQPDVVLQWATLSEKNNSRFNVLHATDGTTFRVIGMVAGAGIANTQNQYHFTDYNAMPGMNYYRLEQKDADGKSTASETITVLKPKTANSVLEVFTKKESGELNFHYHSDADVPGMIIITDMSGHRQPVQAVAIRKGDNTYRLNISLATGIYLLTVQNKKEVTSQKFAW